MKTISLTQGKVTVVDDDVYEWASQHKWFAIYHHDNWYAVRNVRIEGALSRNKRQIIERLHRVIVGAVRGQKTDHKDGDGLNNRRYNLRVCTQTQNLRNQKLRRSNTTGYKGVVYDKATDKFRAQIGVDGRKIALGSFESPAEAARSYDAAAIKYFGEFAKPNSILSRL